MAVRSLSPGINDPGTAIACIHRLGGLLRRLADRRMPSGRRVDEDGRLRIVAEPTRYADLVASCFDAVRRYAARDADAIVALLDAIASGVDDDTPADRRRILAAHAVEIRDAFADAEGGSKRDRDLVAAAFERTQRALALS